jgi:hypothetical protein
LSARKREAQQQSKKEEQSHAASSKNTKPSAAQTKRIASAEAFDRPVAPRTKHETIIA